MTSAANGGRSANAGTWYSENVVVSICPSAYSVASKSALPMPITIEPSFWSPAPEASTTRPA